MKEAIWGVLIVVLGLFGILVVNLFQNVTVDNDRVYYLIKETTQAAAYDAIDLQYYRTTGNMKIAEDKFIENLTRRFAQNVTVGDYTIIVEDLNEVPPKISLRIRSGVTSLRGEEFGLVNRVDGVIEAKYKIDEVIDFLCEDKTAEECNTIRQEFGVKVEIDSSSGENRCASDISDEEMDCIPGDISFLGWGESDLPIGICQDESAPRDKERTARYAICECGKWSSEKTRIVTANPVASGNEYIYTWTFSESTDVRTINESIKERVRKQVCTTDIKVLVPKNPNDLSPATNPNEPSADNSSYVVCPAEGIKILTGTIVKLHPQYVPANAANRKLEWTSSDPSTLAIQYSNPPETCELNNTNSNCLSKAIITAQDILGTKDVTIRVKTTRGQTSTCKVTVWDGTIDTLRCDDIKVTAAEDKKVVAHYTPDNAPRVKLRYSLENTNIATIGEESGLINVLKTGTTTITVKDTYTNKTATCNLEAEGTALHCPIETFEATPTPKQFLVTKTPVGVVTNLTYTIGNTELATVDENGYVTGKKVGTTTITVKDKISNASVTCNINTDDGIVRISKVSCTDDSVTEGEEKALKVDYEPSNATTPIEYTYSSSDESIVTISDVGTLKGIGVGTATITVNSSGKTGTCEITVEESTANIGDPAPDSYNGNCASDKMIDQVWKVPTSYSCAQYGKCPSDYSIVSGDQCCKCNKYNSPATIGAARTCKQIGSCKNRPCATNKELRDTVDEEHTYYDGVIKPTLIYDAKCKADDKYRKCHYEYYCEGKRYLNDPNPELIWNKHFRTGSTKYCRC